MRATETPYLRGRAEFLSVFEDLAKAKRNWQLAALGALAVAVILALGYVRLSTEARITPYVVQVDRLGQARSFGPAEKLEKKDTRVYVFQLSLFIRNVRTVYADPKAQLDLLFDAYAFVAGPAHQVLDEYFAQPAHDPRVLAQTLTREVTIESVIQVPGSHVWKARWIETDRPRAAGLAKRQVWEAYLTTKEDPPQSLDAALRNPFGLFVTDLTWTAVSTPGGSQ